MSTGKEVMKMETELNNTVEEDWKEIARTLQKTFCKTLGDTDWDSYNEFELAYMRKKVGYALFGPPEVFGNDGYSYKQREEIKRICAKIVEEDDHRLYEANSEIWMAIIFVCLAVEIDDTHIEVIMEPVFRVPKYHSKIEDNVAFIDRKCRVYENWKDYLENNKLPACSYCYPKNGIYYLNIFNEVEIEFGKTPASKFTSKLCEILQLANYVLKCSIGVCTCIGSITAPVITGALISSGVLCLYGIGRDIECLIDRRKHKESMEFSNCEARYIWLSLSANIVGVLSVGVTQIVNASASGRMLNVSEKIFLTTFNVITSTVNGVNVVHDVLSLISKNESNEITHFDLMKLISSVIFFGHSVVNTRAAFRLMISQSDIVTSLRSIKYRKVGDNGKIVRFCNYINESYPVACIAPKHGTDQFIEEFVCQFKDTILNGAMNFNPHTSISWHSAGPDNQTHSVAMFNIGEYIWKKLQDVGKMNIPYILDLAEKICNEINFPVGISICQVLKIICLFIKDIVNEMEKLETDRNPETREGIFKFFCTIVIRSVSLVEEIYRRLRDLCYQNVKETVDIKAVMANVPLEKKLTLPWSFSHSNIRGHISKEEALLIANNLTKEDFNLNNSDVVYGELNVYVMKKKHSGNVAVVKLNCCVSDQLIVATVVC